MSTVGTLSPSYQPFLTSREPPLAIDDFRDSEATADLGMKSLAVDRAKLIGDLATAASRVESLISSTYQAYDDMTGGRTSDLPRKSQRVTDMLDVSRSEARRMLDLAYQLLAETQSQPSE